MGEWRADSGGEHGTRVNEGSICIVERESTGNVGEWVDDFVNDDGGEVCTR